MYENHGIEFGKNNIWLARKILLMKPEPIAQ
jgi:hypothetical protein